LHIGSTIWFFDVNNRHYQEGQSAPIYRRHFRPVRIADETRRSWVLDDTLWVGGLTVDRFPKTGPVPSYLYVTPKAVDDACWLDANRREIEAAVRRCRDVARLRTIAAMLGVAEVA
jgi:hypothetical protein